MKRLSNQETNFKGPINSHTNTFETNPENLPIKSGFVNSLMPHITLFSMMQSILTLNGFLLNTVSRNKMIFWGLLEPELNGDHFRSSGPATIESGIKRRGSNPSPHFTHPHSATIIWPWTSPNNF